MAGLLGTSHQGHEQRETLGNVPSCTNGGPTVWRFKRPGVLNPVTHQPQAPGPTVIAQEGLLRKQDAAMSGRPPAVC